jgi:hypothetical protein
MDWASKNSLQEKLEQLREFGTKWHMLFINLDGSSKRLLMGIESGQFTLDLVNEGWLCWLHRRRFVSFCKSHHFPVHSEKWGKEKITRAMIGDSVEQTLETVKSCFEYVYRIEAPFKLELLSVGLKLTKNSSG